METFISIEDTHICVHILGHDGILAMEDAIAGFL